jgi:hypothetical protein
MRDLSREPISKNTDGRTHGGRDRHCHQRRPGRLWLLSYYYLGTFEGVSPSPADSRHQVARIAIAGDDWGLVEAACRTSHTGKLF